MLCKSRSIDFGKAVDKRGLLRVFNGLRRCRDGRVRGVASGLVFSPARDAPRQGACSMSSRALSQVRRCSCAAIDLKTTPTLPRKWLCLACTEPAVQTGGRLLKYPSAQQGRGLWGGRGAAHLRLGLAHGRVSQTRRTTRASSGHCPGVRRFVALPEAAVWLS